MIKVKEEPRYVSLPVDGCKELKIIGTDAGDGVSADRLNLCSLRLSVGTQAPKQAPNEPPRAGVLTK